MDAVIFFKILDALREISAECEKEILECEKALEVTDSRVLEGWVSGAKFVLDKFEHQQREMCREGF